MSKSPKFVLYHALDPCPSSAFHCEGESLTQQHHLESTDINILIQRASANGGFVGDPYSFSKVPPKFDDFSDIPDFQDLCDTVAYGTELFMTLSAKDRESFGNNPAQFFTWLGDPANHQAAVTRGFLSPEESSEPSAPKEEPSVNPESEVSNDV